MGVWFFRYNLDKFWWEENDVEKGVLLTCVRHEICNKLLVDFLEQFPFDIMELLFMTSP
jgi:hypothetical protein